jgi:tryptophan-rich sensory protein
LKNIPLLISSLIALLVAVIGGSLTRIDEWYYSLIQPDWKPPDWIFGPIWTTILTLSAFSAAISYKNSINDSKYRKKLIFLFLLNAVLNITWSLFYFFLQRPDIALFEVVFLWLSILLLIFFTKKKSSLASLMLVPYLVWVSLASFLNYQTVVLNGPFT